VRERLRQRLSRGKLALAMALSAPRALPRLSILTAVPLDSCASLIAIVAQSRPGMWCSGLLRRLTFCSLLLLIAIVYSRAFNYIYTTPILRARRYLGQLMLIRTGALAALELRRVEGIGFGFIPTPERVGRGRPYSSIPARGSADRPLPCDYLIEFHGISCSGKRWPLSAASSGSSHSRGIFFRGLPQQWLTLGPGGRARNLALIATSLVFRRRSFCRSAFLPNWKWGRLRRRRTFLRHRVPQDRNQSAPAW